MINRTRSLCYIELIQSIGSPRDTLLMETENGYKIPPVSSFCVIRIPICNRKNEQINNTTKTTPTTYTLKNEVSFIANSNRMNQNILTHNGTKTNKKKVTIYKQFIICRMK